MTRTHLSAAEPSPLPQSSPTIRGRKALLQSAA